jgi:hypothetical protein
VLSERVHSVYPELLTGLAERVLAPRGGRKRKLLPLARAELKARGIAMTRLVRDLIEGGRAFGW